MIEDIFRDNEKRLGDLRETMKADTLAMVVNDTLERKGMSEQVTGQEIDGFLKLSRLGKRRALISYADYCNLKNLDKDSILE
ncbi:hypothetical protein BCT75_12725 [Vibrio lentus]|uniref:hypothetical protein n=1 Tax=Vibrio lentus TaxID=136468 RepID=UPI000C82B50A|nr:hypothetical protein [Vibrio lentus]PML50658.1 hypothetical protein BCT75_12725 [Vibrio lentus]